jgi:ribosomal protein L20A (L18A)
MGRYSVVGSYLARRGFWQSFTKQLEASNAAAAQERAVSQLGGSHGVARRLIRIESVDELPA